MKSLRMIVSGTVQGVGFRYHTQQQARQLQLLGYVRNLPDGTVEILAEGDGDAVEALLAWTHRGPAAAQVSQVVHYEQPYQGVFTAFEIKA